MRSVLLLLPLLVSFAAAGLAARERKPLSINVFPHSHCDAGYKKTFEGYYETEVLSILRSVPSALQKNPTRRFLWSEVSYLQRWFRGASSDVDRKAQNLFKSLVNSGQIELVDGGWTQHDDAITTIKQQLQNQRIGRKALTQLGFVESKLPRIGWHPDSFGATVSSFPMYDLVIARS